MPVSLSLPGNLNVHFCYMSRSFSKVSSENRCFLQSLFTPRVKKYVNRHTLAPDELVSAKTVARDGTLEHTKTASLPGCSKNPNCVNKVAKSKATRSQAGAWDAL